MRDNINSTRKFFWLKSTIFFSSFWFFFLSNSVFVVAVVVVVIESLTKIYTRCRQSVWWIVATKRPRNQYAMRSKACQIGCKSMIFLENNLRRCKPVFCSWCCRQWHHATDCVYICENARFFWHHIRWNQPVDHCRLRAITHTLSFKCYKSGRCIQRMCPQNVKCLCSIFATALLVLVVVR